MYWTSRGSNARVDSAAMDGSNQTTLIRNLNAPGAITIDYKEDRLYFCDGSRIYSSDLLGNNMLVFYEETKEPKVGIAVDDNYVYWGSTLKQRGIRRLSKSITNQTVSTIMEEEVSNPADIYVSTASPINTTNHGCSSFNGGCTELCLSHPDGFKCACRNNWELQKDGVTCCLSGYTAYAGACFKAYNQEKTYDQARQVCEEDGAGDLADQEIGMLALPKDKDVNNFVRDLKNAVSEISRFWIGLSDQKDEGEWRWADGTEHDTIADWNGWQLGEPNDNQGGEDCANYGGSGWNDAPCSSAYKFICQLRKAITCSLGYFRCSHGRACILSWKRCDGATDCTDGSDETGCVCQPIPGDFQIDIRLAMLPNQLGQTTFEEAQNSSVVELLNTSYSSSGNYHPELRNFVSTVIFPQCNVTEENKADCFLSPNATETISCMGNVTGTQLVPCRSWCEEVLYMAADWMKGLLPRCKLFPSSEHGCWNPNSAKKGNEVCYHGIGINYRGTWSKTTSGADCVEWSVEQAGYYKTEYPWANLDNNYCRNPTGLDRPFCLTEDGSQEDCDVIPCDADGCWDRGPPNYGKRSPGKRFYYVDDRVTYTCNEGYTLKSGYTSEARCMPGGDWQYDKPRCSVNHRRRLQGELLEIYSASLAPENVVINFTGSVEQIVDLDEKKEQLVASVAIDFTWQDSRLSWDPKYYDDVTTLNIPGDNIWTPILTLKRNAASHSLQKDVPVRVSSNGRVAWSVETQTTTVCDADPFYFPADTMECHVCFSAIAAVEQTIQCQGGGSTDKGSSPCNSYSDVTTEGEWHRNDNIFAKDNREACFVVHLKRIPLFHLATTVGPCIILVVLMIITFVMPLDRGDRISFGLTILLSMVVSLVFVTGVLPVKGGLPFFATLIIVCMGLMGVFLLLTMAVIIIHDRKGSLSPMAKIIFLRHISKILLLGDLTEKKHPRDEEADLTDFPATGLINCAFLCDGKVDVNDERPCDGNETTKQPSTPLSSLVPTRTTALLQLIPNLKGVKKEVKELAKAVDNKREVLKKVMMNEEEVSEYILLAKVLDRVLLVLYIISIAAAVPMTMYLGK
ncbi:uncharacterized protein LOC118413782 [Branchiostoma floridae]|uniref:Uncharacterized protein LOC118413782 n=2 Tax=Branchiostoma floridae TaxID=7739 RepID=A0A9J7MN13_BRAFL|nr:uncharacterized protein LOC118413782 [Branchiostoma floridae]